MDSHLIIQKTPKQISFMTWCWIALSICSCSSRPDYNVILGFLVLLLRRFDTSDKRQFFSKAALHILLLSCIFDGFWIVKYTGIWRHGRDTSDLWKSLSFIHNFVYYLGYVELLVKIPLIYYYYKQFRSYGTTFTELFSIKYSN